MAVNNGCVLYKLVLRAFPRHFRPNSVYAHYPLVCPDENRSILTKLNVADDYNFDKPRSVPDILVTNSYAVCREILSNKDDFHVTWGVDAIEFLMQHSRHPYGKNFMLSGDGPENMKSRELMQPSLYRERWDQEVKAFYEDITLRLLHRHSYQLAGVNQVDIVRDVSNIAQVHFAASVFSFPLKTDRNPRGIYSESELYLLMALIFTCIFFDADPAKSFPLRQAARKLTQQLGRCVELNVEFVSKAGVIADFLDRFYRHDALTDYGEHIIRRLLTSGLSVQEIVWTHILPTAGGKYTS